VEGIAFSAVVAAALSALATGATASLHCALMCGPLACAALPRGGSSVVGPALTWHLGRVAAYSLVGAGLGLVGTGVARALSVSVTPWLPWVMAAALVVTAFDLGKHLAPIPGVKRISTALARAGGKLPVAGRTMALGAATPFLPCGLLYGLFLGALATGSAGGGSLVMGAFALGGTPALFGAQLGARVGQRYPRASQVLRRVVPLTAAIILIYRALSVGADPAACK
jgi:sulfite exporter TauE/SafE